MPSLAFIRHRFPKVHPLTVEECRAFELHPLLPYLREEPHDTVSFPPEGNFPGVTLVRRARGVHRQWFLVCPAPRCGRLCKALFMRPDRHGGLQCRRCRSLVYVSQRYGESLASCSWAAQLAADWAGLRKSPAAAGDERLQGCRARSGERRDGGLP